MEVRTRLVSILEPFGWAWRENWVYFKGENLHDILFPECAKRREKEGIPGKYCEPIRSSQMQ